MTSWRGRSGAELLAEEKSPEHSVEPIATKRGKVRTGWRRRRKGAPTRRGSIAGHADVISVRSSCFRLDFEELEQTRANPVGRSRLRLFEARCRNRPRFETGPRVSRRARGGRFDPDACRS